MYTANLPHKIAAALRDELQMGEILKWAGQSSPYKSALRPIILALFFGLPWLLISGFMMSMAILFVMGKVPMNGQYSNGFSWMGLAAIAFTGLFVFMGLAIIAAPFYGIYEAKHSVYAITDRRIFTLKLMSNRKIISLVELNSICKVNRLEYANGGGSLWLDLGKYSDGVDLPGTHRLLISHVQDIKSAQRALDDLLANRLAPNKPA